MAVSSFLALFRKRPASSPADAAALAHLPAMRQFLAEIGIPTQDARLEAETFLPGILIENGGLLLDPAKLLYPGDILHEAGHLAVTPAAERTQLAGNVMAGKPEQHGTDGEEIAAMLWSYAAAQAIGVPLEIVFHPAGYRNSSQWIMENFRQGVYPGLPLLAWMGLTTAETFPSMTRWLRE
ncbi:hypothetical protein ACFST9_24775 [Hymenobacter monticola]|uniref:Uncharacterized protein n=1 Tax=Hymenobacter monticola TaxID=1705399 RepID=A0ABY4B7U9_9BACT|nr:hypothetical protein [Hymenobacter monticola]UOE34814.1 hypothetical protein MTP16_03960 [Hymenobacter monticola]